MVRNMIKEVLRKDDIHEHLEQDSHVETSNGTGAWKMEDGQAWSHLVLHLGEEAITNITPILAEEATAQVVWDILKSIYQK